MKHFIMADDLIKKICALEQNERYVLYFNRANSKYKKCEEAYCIFNLGNTFAEGEVFMYNDVSGVIACCHIDNIAKAVIGNDTFYIINK